MSHTPGAVRAAEIITQLSYDDRFAEVLTEYGPKQCQGIAGIIEQETALPELLAACENYLYGRKDARECEAEMRAAIAKATRKAVP